MFQTSTVFSTDTKTQFFFRGKACTKKSYTHKHTHRASRQMLHNTLYTALNQRSPGQGQELNLRASITFSKTQLILCLSTTNTHTEHLFPLSHSFALFPTLHSMQRAHDCERKSACMYACVWEFVCVYLSLFALWLWWCAWRHCLPQQRIAAVCFSSRSQPPSPAVVSAPSSCSWKLHSAWMSC